MIKKESTYKTLEKTEFVKVTWEWDWTNKINGTYSMIMPKVLWDGIRSIILMCDFSMGRRIGNITELFYDNGEKFIAACSVKDSSFQDLLAAIRLFSDAEWGLISTDIIFEGVSEKLHEIYEDYGYMYPDENRQEAIDPLHRANYGELLNDMIYKWYILIKKLKEEINTEK